MTDERVHALDGARRGMVRGTRRSPATGAVGWDSDAAVVTNVGAFRAGTGDRSTVKHAEHASSRNAMPPADQPDLAPLVRRMAEEDPDALGAFYDLTSPVVYGLALRIVQDRSIAEDVTIEVYVQAFRQATSYDLARGTPLAWLVTLARSRAIDRLRRDARQRAWQDDLESAAALPSSDADPEGRTRSSKAPSPPRRIMRAWSSFTPTRAAGSPPGSPA
jgi:RNA polymerase sigma factor (sigma-70 family)